MSIDYAQAFNDALDAAESGDEGHARALLEKVVAADGRDGEAVLMLARLERNAQEIVQAKGRIEALLDLVPNHVDGLVELADILLEQGQPGEAAGHLRTVLVDRPNHWEALLLLGDAFSDAGAFAEATAAYQECLESNPFSSDAWFNLASSQETQGNLLAASAAYQGYLQVRPDAEDRDEVRAHIKELEASAQETP